MVEKILFMVISLGLIIMIRPTHLHLAFGAACVFGYFIITEALPVCGRILDHWKTKRNIKIIQRVIGNNEDIFLISAGNYVNGTVWIHEYELKVFMAYIAYFIRLDLKAERLFGEDYYKEFIRSIQCKPAEEKVLIKTLKSAKEKINNFYFEREFQRCDLKICWTDYTYSNSLSKLEDIYSKVLSAEFAYYSQLYDKTVSQFYHKLISIVNTDLQ